MKTNIFEENYKKLNQKQKEACDSIYWPVMVIAWPWTWKTQIIAIRTANILIKTDTPAENIFITTFTEAWVIAIKERLIKFIWKEAYKVNISTIHSFSSDVIKTFPEKFIEYKASTSIDDVEQLEIIKNLLNELINEKEINELTNDYDKFLYLRDIKSRISQLKQEWISISRFNQIIKEQELSYETELSEIKPSLKKYETTKNKQETHINKLKELVIIWWEYNKYLRENSFYDFNDMINFVLEKFRLDEDLRLHYAEKFQFIMLDEFQDTNNAQNEIIDLILNANQLENSETSASSNIMVVWDDDQSIYRFQWANIENMLDFSTKYKDTKFVVLQNNYRSTQNILDISKRLIENNNSRLSKKIDSINKNLVSSWKYKTQDISANLYIAKNDIDEKSYILEKIKIELENKKIPLNEIAIIVRNNREVEEWSIFLNQNWFNVESKQKTDILKSNYINLLLDYLKIIENPLESEIEFLNLIRSDLVWLNQIDIFKINRFLYLKNYKLKNKISFVSFLFDIERFLDLKDAYNNLEDIDIESFIDFRNKLNDLIQVYKTKSFIEFFNHFLVSIWFFDFLQKKWNFDDIEDVYTLFNLIKTWIEKDKNFWIISLISKLDLYKNYNYPINRQILWEQKSWIQVLTAHSSKWLEFETVFIPWLYYWNWENKIKRDKLKLPNNIAWEWLQEKQNDIEEDRRLFFVALTRAKKQLYLSYPSWIWTKVCLASSFISEIEENLKHEEFEIKLENINEIIQAELCKSTISYSINEFDYINEFLKNYKLSASDLNTFLRDPKEFLNRVVFKYPFIDNKYTIFWNVYHRTLELFYLKYKNEKNIPDRSYLTATFSLLLEKEFLTGEEFSNLKEKWINWLNWYYDLYSNSLKEPLALEYNFSKKNIFYEDIPLTWKIDKIELISNTSPLATLPAGDGNNIWQQALFRENILLIDYKTWKAKSIWEIKWVDRYGNKKETWWEYFRQLMFYKLLCENDKEIYSRFDIWWFALDFVEGRDSIYKIVEVDCSLEEYEDFKNLVKETWQKINDIDFWKEVLDS